jgi:hypothetical protein
MIAVDETQAEALGELSADGGLPEPGIPTRTMQLLHLFMHFPFAAAIAADKSVPSTSGVL